MCFKLEHDSELCMLHPLKVLRIWFSLVTSMKLVSCATFTYDIFSISFMYVLLLFVFSYFVCWYCWIALSILTARHIRTCRGPAPFPLKIAPSRVGIWTPSNTWFLRPTHVHIVNGISIGSAVFAGLTIVTDQPTNRPRYSISSNRLHLANTVIGPNNSCYADAL